MSSQERLEAHIVSLSDSDNWHDARSEWDLYEIYKSDSLEECPCGTPIREICVLLNHKNGNQTEVGNVCVNKFLKLPSVKLFQSVRYVLEHAGGSFSEELLEYAHNKRMINDWELNFYQDIRKKRSLSGKQKQKKLQINEKILARISR